MKTYSVELKSGIIAKMLPPINVSIVSKPERRAATEARCPLHAPNA
ncbi:MAG: hypothetical protein HZB87_01060 [Desulfatitalea sp.]|nr:hypothetical protein [Desulfatitalea sp.]MBI5895314.1 hypothetical protein [Desulfobacterales bacterium]